MKVVVFAWATAGEREFEERFALSFLGNRYRELGFTGTIELVFLSGLENLSPEYRRDLETSAFALRDASALLARAEESFPGLVEFSPTHRKWLLRCRRSRPLRARADPPSRRRRCPERRSSCPGPPRERPDVRSAGVSGPRCDLRSGLVRPVRGGPRALAEDPPAYSRAAWAERTGLANLDADALGRQPLRGGDSPRSGSPLASDPHRTPSPGRSPRTCCARSRTPPVREPLFFDLELDFTSFRYVRQDSIDYFDCVYHESPGGRRAPASLCWHLPEPTPPATSERLWSWPATREACRSAGCASTSARSGSAVARRVSVPSRLELYRRVFASGDFAPAFDARRWWRVGVFSTFLRISPRRDRATAASSRAARGHGARAGARRRRARRAR